MHCSMRAHMHALAFGRYMPNLYNLIAAQGVTFNNFLCTTSMCCPSRTNILTGRCTHNTEVASNGGQAYDYASGEWVTTGELRLNCSLM